MDEFITMQVILSFAGSVALITGATQFAKKFVNYDPKWLVLIFSIIVSLVRVVFVADYSLQGIILGILNIIPVGLASIGAYETILKASSKDETNK